MQRYGCAAGNSIRQLLVRCGSSCGSSSSAAAWERTEGWGGRGRRGRAPLGLESGGEGIDALPELRAELLWLPAAQVRGPWPRSGRRPAYLPLLFVVRRRAGPCFVPSVVRRRHGFSPFPPWPGPEAAARVLLTALAVRREEPVGGSLGRARSLGRRPADGWQHATPSSFDGRRPGAVHCRMDGRDVACCRGPMRGLGIGQES